MAVDKRPSRRQALARLASASAALAGSYLERLAAQHPCSDPATAGTLLGTLPLSRDDGIVQPFGVKFGGRGLDARLITDVSTLEPDRLVTPNAQVFVRTECPTAVVQHRGPWSIKTSGLVAAAGSITADDLTRAARPMGTHLIECSGNNNPANFGLISVAEWHGVPLVEVITRLQPVSGATAVFVGGIDHDTQRSASSTAGASWVFPLSSLARLGAFLATQMNGEPLALDHGRPVRLVVPGWYACTWIKWVNEIRLVAADEPATSQMREFAARTHQSARYARAADYSAATIEAAAMPIRVEKRRSASGLAYRVVGIVWGGGKPVDRLAIRFSSNDAWTPFPICPAPATHTTWWLWDCRWKPARSGLHDITLRVPDPAVPQRRLDLGYYRRQVRITEL